jgi:hypothetical protein
VLARRWAREVKAEAPLQAATPPLGAVAPAR